MIELNFLWIRYINVEFSPYNIFKKLLDSSITHNDFSSINSQNPKKNSIFYPLGSKLLDFFNDNKIDFISSLDTFQILIILINYHPWEEITTFGIYSILDFEESWNNVLKCLVAPEISLNVFILDPSIDWRYHIGIFVFL